MRWRRKEREQDLQHELLSHLQLEAEQLEQNGTPPQEARFAARRTLGNATLIEEVTREM